MVPRYTNGGFLSQVTLQGFVFFSPYLALIVRKDLYEFVETDLV